MPVLETLAPLILLIALGAVLARIRFLGRDFMADLNKLAFWIALPALLFTSATHATEPGGQTWRLLAVMIGGTLLITAVAWAASFALRMPSTARGTLMQSAFRGNLTYIGIPVLAYILSEDQKAMATAVIVMVCLMASYNLLAVIVLQSSQPNSEGTHWGRILRSVATNPLILAGFLGLSVPMVGLTTPLFVDRALQALGQAAVPIALLCIGGSLATTSLQGRKLWIFAAALLKVAILPLIVFWLGHAAGLGPAEQLIALVLTSCPTAATSYIMAKQMGGDEALVSGSIVLSTMLSAVSLAVVLWIS